MQGCTVVAGYHLDCLGEALQPVDHGNQDILDAASLACR